MAAEWQATIGDEACWIWPSYEDRPKDSKISRPQVMIEGKNVTAHRAMFKLLVGAIGSKHLHHRCEDGRCVNPFHLQPMTKAEHNRHHKRRPYASRRGGGNFRPAAAHR
jgi:hypothetical protein